MLVVWGGRPISTCGGDGITMDITELLKEGSQHCWGHYGRLWALYSFGAQRRWCLGKEPSPNQKFGKSVQINHCKKEKDIWIRVKSNSPSLQHDTIYTIWYFHNLKPSKLEGCRLALRRCVEARQQDVECLSTLSVLCLVIVFFVCLFI